MDSYLNRRKRPKHQKLKLVLFLAFVIVAVLICAPWLQKEDYETLGIQSVPTPSTPIKAVTNLVADTLPTTIEENIPLSLASTVQQALDGTTASYSIAIKKLDNDESYYLNEHQSYEAGSLYKLWVMATVFQQIQNGALQADETLTQKASVLNTKFRIDPQDAEITGGTITMTTTDALSQMITISHNYAALLLTEKIRLSSVANFLKQHGFTRSTVGTTGAAPTTTASDVSLFFDKLYTGKLANPEYTGKMIQLLKKQQLNNKLPKYLPTNVTIAHKTGEIGGFSHDAGIVYAPTGKYIISILSESDTPSQTEELIAKISDAVYKYFSLN